MILNTKWCSRWVSDFSSMQLEIIGTAVLSGRKEVSFSTFVTLVITRMHSSRMRTAHSLTVFCHILCTPPPAIMHTPHNHTWNPPQPCMPPSNHTPHDNHTCPPQPHIPPAVTHAPQQPHMPPHNHACPPCNHACPLQPCMPPATMYTPTAMHTPRQPCMPPSPVDRMTHTCKNITLSQTSFAGGKNVSISRTPNQFHRRFGKCHSFIFLP